jgi:hypothetical protein
VIARAAVLGVMLLLVLVTPASGGSDRRSPQASTCAKGSVDAVIDGRRTCLRRGQRCVKRADGQYHAYWFHCHSGRLVAMPAAARVIASIPAPAVGGLAIGAGSVWVANMNPYTVTRIDPATNTVVATISLGEPDYLWGPTRLAFAHGSLWVLDGKSSSVARIDPETNRVLGWIPLGMPTQASTGPLGIAATTDALWVTNTWGTTDAQDGSVVKIDPRSGRIVARLGLGSSPEDSGPLGVAAGSDAIWVGVASTKSVVRVDPASAAPVAEVGNLDCARGQLAVDDTSVWAADCTSLVRIDSRTNSISKRIPMPRASGMGVIGVSVGLGSVWVQAGSLVRIDPVSGAVRAVLSLPPVYIDCGYSIAFGFDSIWVRQHDRVVRLRP